MGETKECVGGGEGLNTGNIGNSQPEGEGCPTGTQITGMVIGRFFPLNKKNSSEMMG